MAKRTLVNVVNLGLINYRSALKIQDTTAKQLINALPGNKQNTLYILEHHPIYTVGIRSKEYSKEEEERLLSLQADFYRSDRGGLITFHGPGQLVAYPIFDLKAINSTLKNYVCSLERVAIETAKEFGLTASTTENVGVWVGDNKLAAIGVHASHFVTTHGIAINCNTDLAWFEHIVPCGIKGKGVTSLTRELGRNVCVDEATGAFLKSFKRIFDCEFIETKHSSN